MRGCEASCGAPLGTSGHRKSMSLSAASRIGSCLACAISSTTRVCDVLLVIGAELQGVSTAPVPKNVARYLQGARTWQRVGWSKQPCARIDHDGVRQRPFQRPRRFALQTLRFDLCLGPETAWFPWKILFQLKKPVTAEPVTLHSQANAQDGPCGSKKKASRTTNYRTIPKQPVRATLKHVNDLRNRIEVFISATTINNSASLTNADGVVRTQAMHLALSCRVEATFWCCHKAHVTSAELASERLKSLVQVSAFGVSSSSFSRR